jgi:predicted metal-binding transcription factor (methanogenesis marker protein 9)
MGASQQPTKLSNLQLELLKLYAYPVSDEELMDIKKMLADYFAKKLDEEVDRVWKEKGYTQETIKQWKKEHFRVKSK